MGDPTATLSPTATRLLIDNLEMIVRFAGKSTGTLQTVEVHTTDPERHLALTIGVDGCSLAPSPSTSDPASPGTPDLVLPAEAFVRLVYGRLDADHAPPVTAEAALLDRLRCTFPGI